MKNDIKERFKEGDCIHFFSIRQVFCAWRYYADKKLSDSEEEILLVTENFTFF